MEKYTVHLRYYTGDPLEEIGQEDLDRIGNASGVGVSFQRIDNRTLSDGRLREETLEKAIEDIRAICISSMYWKNDEYPSCARILAHHHKIVTDAQVKIAELTAIEYGDTDEVEHS